MTRFVIASIIQKNKSKTITGITGDPRFWKKQDGKKNPAGVIVLRKIQRDADASLMSARWWTVLQKTLHDLH